MKNYLISERQLGKILEQVKEVEAASIKDLRKVHSVLAPLGFEPEQIVDIFIGLRTQDPYVIHQMMSISDDVEFLESVEKLSRKNYM